MNKEQQKAYIHSIGVSRWSLPFPSGEGTGEGPLTYRDISVITLLPSGEGKGEGPVLLCLLPLLAERLLFICENLWEIKHPTSLLDLWKNLTRTHAKALTRRERHKQGARTQLTRYQTDTDTKGEGHVQGWRRAYSWGKKGVFLNAEGPCLARC